MNIRDFAHDPWKGLREMQKPSGTQMPSIRKSSPRFAPLPPTSWSFVLSTPASLYAPRFVRGLLADGCAPNVATLR
jgi:hypothetical protein